MSPLLSLDGAKFVPTGLIPKLIVRFLILTVFKGYSFFVDLNFKITLNLILNRHPPLSPLRIHSITNKTRNAYSVTIIFFPNVDVCCHGLVKSSSDGLSGLPRLK